MVSKKTAKDKQNFIPRIVDVKNAHAVHAAIASGELPLSMAPINLSELNRWATQSEISIGEVYGLEIKIK